MTTFFRLKSGRSVSYRVLIDSVLYTPHSGGHLIDCKNNLDILYCRLRDFTPIAEIDTPKWVVEFSQKKRLNQKP